jgi:hypothetical protein
MPDKVKNQWGEELEMDTDVYPKGSPAKEGKEPTPPSGQGGASPKNRPDYQDQWPANPPPSESAQAQADLNDEMRKAGVPQEQAALYASQKAAEASTSTEKASKK